MQKYFKEPTKEGSVFYLVSNTFKLSNPFLHISTPQNDVTIINHYECKSNTFYLHINSKSNYFRYFINNYMNS